MQNAQLTGSLATALFEQLVDSIEEAVDDNRQISHSEVARRTVSRLDSLSEQLGLPGAQWLLRPYVNSGGTPPDTRRSDNNSLSFTCILASLGVEWQGSRALCTRTLLVEPKDSVQRLYSALVDMLQVCTATLQHGVPLKDVHDRVRGYVASRDPSLLTALPTHFGELLGTSKKQISAESTDSAQTGELYALVLSLQTTEYLELTDTVAVVAGPAVIITSTKRKFNDVAYYLNDAEDLAPEPTKQTPALRRASRKHQLAQSSSEQKRKLVQKELRLKKLDELRDRFQTVKPAQAEAASTRLLRPSLTPGKRAYPTQEPASAFPRVHHQERVEE